MSEPRPATPPATLRNIAQRLSGGWYVGAVASVAGYGPQTFMAIQESPAHPALRVLSHAIAAVFFVVFILGTPRTWPTEPTLGRQENHPRAGFVVLGLLTALSLTLWPAIGSQAVYTWPFIVSSAAMVGLGIGWRCAVIGTIVAASAALILFSGPAERNEYGLFFWILVSLSLVMLAFARQIEIGRQLRATQHALASAAVAAERSRMSRDLHDILGHSLTVIAVKAELAAKLLEAQPAAAASELGDIERLARTALADVRATVSGRRSVTLSSELVHARQALDSAGIEADLPTAVDAVPPERHTLFGYVVREGVTNVLRHAAARHCRVTVNSASIAIDDDGTAPHPGSPGSGTGLAGLAERVREAGGTLTTSRSDLGGFHLRAEFARSAP
ncbi:sensor histidine kinase [Micrococcales bacterium 31B]|nr:sensor histidine kinase [Micrococcales bacterium 31B]